jgi:hypothetical protein
VELAVNDKEATMNVIARAVVVSAALLFAACGAYQPPAEGEPAESNAAVTATGETDTDTAAPPTCSASYCCWCATCCQSAGGHLVFNTSPYTDGCGPPTACCIP